mgnify:CR=1 FL=1
MKEFLLYRSASPPRLVSLAKTTRDGPDLSGVPPPLQLVSRAGPSAALAICRAATRTSEHQQELQRESEREGLLPPLAAQRLTLTKSSGQLTKPFEIEEKYFTEPATFVTTPSSSSALTKLEKERDAGNIISLPVGRKNLVLAE